LEKLIAYIQKIVPELKIQEQMLRGAFQKESVAKDTLLLDFGQVCEHYYFVNKGALRIFFYDEGEEYTSWIAFEDYFFTEQFSYTDCLPSRYAITAIEETEVLKIHKQQMHSLLQNSYEWQQFFIQNEQQTILRLMETIELFQRQPAKERYEALFSFPAFIQKVKQKDLATMLGMTKYSISRLKSYK